MYNFTKGCYNMLSGAGIYIFYHKDSVLYVGQTGDFKKRIYQHWQAAFIANDDSPLYDYIRMNSNEITFEVIEDNDRFNKEMELIKSLNPRFNIIRALKNQRVITIHRKTENDGGISSASLELASKLLVGEVPFKLYIYFATREDGEEISFSPQFFAERYNVSVDRARKVFPQLVDAGYLVPINEYHYHFYETPWKER